MSTKQHSFPSHVSVQSFVTVKLSDKHMYGLWETQMLCLLESHDLLGYINQSSPVAADDDEWSRWDTLVHAWILGSLSEHTAVDVLNRLNSRQTYLTAKDVWNEVRSMYGQQATADRVQEWKVGTNGMLLKEKVKEERERSRIKQDLYHAVECGKLEDVKSILNKGVIGITDSISINGNTALHIAASNSNGILESLLNLRPTDIPLKDVRNEDGSTLLHLAVSHGNMNAAKILVNWSRDLLYAKDNHGFTPLDIVLSQPLNKEMCHFLIDQDAQIPIVAHEPLLNVISYGHFDLALTFIKRCNSFKSRAVLMAIAQNCPADFTPNQLLVYELFQTPVRQFITRGASDMKSCMKFANFVIRAVLAYPYKLLIQICMKLRVFKDLEEKMQQRKNARDLLDVACALIKFSREETTSIAPCLLLCCSPPPLLRPDRRRPPLP
ncbi:hypothetical protein QVD17_27782 [Tagetes erecta]|uniref:Uncharacterized protein n=1 Tax=Tagetes erecta TaxID=13708 RepID=A0AAD8NRP0_TARER|nr:hypothetical protein QVD17_27782 [Tagetes erecta]